MKKIAILDYGLGNIFSIRQALIACGVDPVVTNSVHFLNEADGILLPGVGAFGDAMDRLKHLKLVDVLVNLAQDGKPMLGVCLGMQLLFSESEEFGRHVGLGIIDGRVQKFSSEMEGKRVPVPFIGWNKINLEKKDSLFAGLDQAERMFFVHSFYVAPENRDYICATTDYHSFKYPVVVRKRNIVGIQGHPEKSGEGGLKMYSNWIHSVGGNNNV